MAVPIDEYQRRMKLIDRVFILLTILFFAILISFMIVLVNERHLSHKAVELSRENAELVEQNQHQINIDRQNMIISCRHAYSGIKEVFEIFFPLKPSKQQARDLKRFNNRIKELQLRCDNPRQ